MALCVVYLVLVRKRSILEKAIGCHAKAAKQDNIDNGLPIAPAIFTVCAMT
jgi:hypothetical protein